MASEAVEGGGGTIWVSMAEAACVSSARPGPVLGDIAQDGLAPAGASRARGRQLVAHGG